jgi:hypothetical protein
VGEVVEVGGGGIGDLVAEFVVLEVEELEI